MLHLKCLSKEQKEICENGESILYFCRNDLGNFIEAEIIKHNGKYYRVRSCNKYIKEFVEV